MWQENIVVVLEKKVKEAIFTESFYNKRYRG